MSPHNPHFQTDTVHHDAVPTTQVIWWMKVTAVGVAETGTLATCVASNPTGTVFGTRSQTVKLVNSHQVGDVVLVIMPVGGTDQQYNGRIVSLQEVPSGGLPIGTFPGTSYMTVTLNQMGISYLFAVDPL